MAATERHLRRRRHRDDPHRPSSAPHPPATGAVLSFSGVEMRYSATDVALDHVSFDIFPGEFVFLVGHSGSGKSTAMKLLIKELEPTEGEIRVAGRDLQKIPRQRVPYYRRNLGVIFQDYKLLPNRTVYENVAYALQVTGGSRREIRDKVPDILRLTGPPRSFTTSRTSSPAASSSAWRSPGRWPTSRRSCWPTNRREISTPPPAARSSR